MPMKKGSLPSLKNFAPLPNHPLHVFDVNVNDNPETRVSHEMHSTRTGNKMSGNKSWTEDEVKDLISKWESYPELWDVKNKLYKNRITKQKALRHFATEFNTVESEVTRKLHNLRTQFNQELRKTLSKKSGAGADTTYESAWRNFAPLKFLSCAHSNPPTVNNLVSTLCIFYILTEWDFG